MKEQNIVNNCNETETIDRDFVAPARLSDTCSTPACRYLEMHY